MSSTQVSVGPPPLRTVVKVVEGQTTVAVMNLPWGRKVGPVSVGSASDWTIYGEGVLAAHVLLAFDGQQLHAMPANATNYVEINGQVLDARWWAVPVHSEIRFGAVVLRVACEDIPAAAPGLKVDEKDLVATASDGGKLRQYAEQLRSQHPAEPPTPSSRNPIGGGANTMLAAPSPGQRVSLPAPPAPAPSRELPTPRPAAGSPAPPSGASHGQPKPSGAFAKAWRETSLVKKLTLFVLPFAAVGTFFTWDEPAPAPEARHRPKPHASASGSAHAATAPSASSTSAPDSLARGSAAPATSAAPSASADAAPTTSSSAAKAPAPADSAAEVASTAPSSSAAPTLMVLPATNGGPKARRALDAAFAGRYDQAQALYEALAKEHPEQPEFRFAAERAKDHAVRRP